MKNSGWTHFIATRWYRAGKEQGASLRPATLGIGVGVAALLCVIGVMNGFQMGFIDAVLDFDSYHIRIPSSSASPQEILEALPDALCAVPFTDIRTMVVNSAGKASAFRIKIMPDNLAAIDPTFRNKLVLVSGELRNGLLVGSELAKSLDLLTGETVSVLSVMADEEEGVSAEMVDLTVSGIFHSGYYDFDSALAFIPLSASAGLGKGEDSVIGVRLEDRFADARALLRLKNAGIDDAQSWREYNRAFFGALRMEKSVMMMLVGLIFIVVGVNIFHSMRKAVYGRIEDIATMKALGADSGSVRYIFIINGLVAGGKGAFIGLIAGLLVTMNINGIFALMENALGFISSLFGNLLPVFRFFSPDLFYIGDVPVKLLYTETMFITLAGALSALAAAWVASSRVSKILPLEVLRDE